MLGGAQHGPYLLIVNFVEDDEVDLLAHAIHRLVETAIGVARPDCAEAPADSRPLVEDQPVDELVCCRRLLAEGEHLVRGRRGGEAEADGRLLGHRRCVVLVLVVLVVDDRIVVLAVARHRVLAQRHSVRRLFLDSAIAERSVAERSVVVVPCEGLALGHALQLDQIVARAVGRQQRTRVLEVLAVGGACVGAV
eukprot:3684429-Prymnesium_polylepis.1